MLSPQSFNAHIYYIFLDYLNTMCTVNPLLIQSIQMETKSNSVWIH